MWEGIFEARLSRLVTINKEHYGFILRKASADAMFALFFGSKESWCQERNNGTASES